MLGAAGWPNGKSVVLMIGHQPSVGQAISLLLGLKQDSCPVRKGALWWIRTRERDGDVQTVVVTVQSPELLCRAQQPLSSTRQLLVFCQASTSSRSRCADWGYASAQSGAQAMVKARAPSAAR